MIKFGDKNKIGIKAFSWSLTLLMMTKISPHLSHLERRERVKLLIITKILAMNSVFKKVIKELSYTVDTHQK